MSRPAKAIACAVVLMLRTASLLACSAEEEEAKKFTMWNYANFTDPANGINVAYEIRRTGFHSAEVHFKNLSQTGATIEFSLPDYQSPHANSQIHIPASYPVDIETVVPITLERGSNGVNFGNVMITSVKRDDQLAALPQASTYMGGSMRIDSEIWMGVVPCRPNMYFSGESVSAHIQQHGNAADIIFKNNSRTPLFFDFRIDGYQTFQPGLNKRVAIAVGEQCSVSTYLDRVDALLPLARIKAFNIRSDNDSGEFLDATDLENGWYPVTAINCQNINSNQLVYSLTNMGDKRAKLRFKNLSRLPVTFAYGIGSPFMISELTIAANSDTVVNLTFDADSIHRAMARVRVTNVVYGGSTDNHEIIAIPAK